MNALVNGRCLARPITGVERYGREILCRLRSRTKIVRYQGRAGSPHGHLWEQIALSGQVGSGQVLWSPANTGPLLVRNQALTLHDLSPLEHPEWFRRGFAVWYRIFLPLLAKRVRKIFTPSEYVKQKACRRFGITNVTVTPNGVDHSLFGPNAKQTRFD